jgi:hypothetical protein
MKVCEKKIQEIYFSGRHGVLEDEVQLNGWKVLVVNNIKNLGTSFHRMMT